MQHLNIPLSRNSKTTRRTRWVVWLLAFGVGLLILGTSWISTLWFTRDTIYAAAPENTVMAVRLFVSEEKGESVETAIKNFPLISNRSITFSDLAQYISGEFVLFLNVDGSRSVALREGKTPLPQTLLDAQSITMQPIKNNIVLLSEKNEVLKPLSLHTKIIPGFSYPGHQWIGELIEINQPRRSFVYASKNQIFITLPGFQPTGSVFKHIPKNTFAYLSNPLLPNTSKDFLDPFLPLMQSIVDPQFLGHLSTLSSEKSQIILTKDEQGIGFFLATKDKEGESTINNEQALRSISALNAPKIQETFLSDGSSIKELIANPDAVSVEQITLLGTQVNRIQINGTDILTGSTKKKEVFLTNRENLFREQTEGNKSFDKICSGNVAGFNLQPLVDMQNQYAHTPNTNPILLFAQNFSSIGVKTNWFSTSIHLCK